MFAQHLKFGITLQIPKKFLNYHLKTAETVAMSARTAEKTRSPEALARAARMAKEQAKVKQAAAAKAKAKAKAKASEKEDKRLLAEAVKVAAEAAKAAKAAKAAVEEEAASSKAVKPVPGPATEQDGEKSKAAKSDAAMATAEATEAEAARLGAEAARPLVQAGRAHPLIPCRARATHAATRTLTLTRCKWS